MATYTGFGASAPAVTYGADTAAYTLATCFRVTSPGLFLTRLRLYLSSNGGAVTAGQVTGAGSLLAVLYAENGLSAGAGATELTERASLASVTMDAWNEFPLTPYPLTVGSAYYAAVLLPAGRYSLISGRFASDLIAGPITFPANGGAQGASGTVRNGAFAASATLVPPSNSFNQSWYGIDVFLDDAPGGITPDPYVITRAAHRAREAQARESGRWTFLRPFVRWPAAGAVTSPVRPAPGIATTGATGPAITATRPSGGHIGGIT